MADALQKVQPGDPLAIPAATFNTFIDVAQDFKQRQQSTAQDRYREPRQTGILLVRNESGAERNRFDVLGITGPLVKPTENANEFYGRVALRGGVPQESHVGRFVVLLEPLRVNAIGRACLDGVCVVRVKMNAETDMFAEVKTGQTDKLESAPSGSAALLWVQPPGERSPDPTVAWTVAKLGNAGVAVVTVIVTAINPAWAKLYGPNGAVGDAFQLWGWNFAQTGVNSYLGGEIYPSLKVNDTVPALAGTMWYRSGTTPYSRTGYFCLLPVGEAVCT